MPLNPGAYDERYYMDGIRSGVSLYENYRWLPSLSIPMAHAIQAHLGAQPGETLLDFGCARGYVVRAFRMLGIAAWGVDLSPWAVTNADPEIAEFITEGDAPPGEYDWIVAKDVLEHLPPPRLSDTLIDLCLAARQGIFIVVPLSASAGSHYVIPEYERDVTHQIRLPLGHWAAALCAASAEVAPGQWTVTAGYRVPGVKDNYAFAAGGNGFLTARKGG